MNHGSQIEPQARERMAIAGKEYGRGQDGKGREKIPQATGKASEFAAEAFGVNATRAHRTPAMRFYGHITSKHTWEAENSARRCA